MVHPVGEDTQSSMNVETAPGGGQGGAGGSQNWSLYSFEMTVVAEHQADRQFVEVCGP